MEKERFSLLLLEPHEIYFEDYSVDLKTYENTKSISGRLKICSKSLLFEPRNLKYPLIKIQFVHCSEIKELSTPSNSLIVRCSQNAKLLENNVIAPYKFDRDSKSFLFTFNYIQVGDRVLPFCEQLKRASSLPSSEQSDMIATMVYSLHCRTKFDHLWMEDIFEKVIGEYKVNEISPLVLNPGRLLLTDSCLYFQTYNNIHPEPVTVIKNKDIEDFIRKRFLLRYIGLEIKWKNGKNLYVSFENESDLVEFLTKTKELSNIRLSRVEAESMALKWQNNKISNFEYLMYLNNLADRSFSDLTQYPVFPWIITDYTSQEIDLKDDRIFRDLTKPIGALNPDRLEKLKERCEEMDEPKYLYGSHYSTPGFVLFYLVRKYPHLMLCLQNGRFDHPDRMFNNVGETFKNCLCNMSDFKELIPEFYDDSSSMEFLVNSYRINFGTRHDGSAVNNVILPPWAKNSPKLFGKILREALESDYVSANLHHWIDLIFGYKQRGKEAELSDNLFYHLCYEGAIDLKNIIDPAEKHALEVQISEFGQIPKQLFQKPHVARNLPQKLQLSPSSISHHSLEFENIMAYNAHRDSITSVVYDTETDIIISTSKDGILKCYSLEERRQTRSISMGSSPLSSCTKIPNTNVIALGSWENNILLYNCSYGKTTETIPAHEDSVTCLCIVEELGILISGSWDCSVKLWKGFDKIDEKVFRLSNSMIASCFLEEKVNCLTYKLTEESLQIVIGIESGEILFWNLPRADLKSGNFHTDFEEPKMFLKHPQKINALAFNCDFSKLASSSQDGTLIVSDVLTGMNLFDRKFTSPATDLCWFYDELEFLLLVNYVGEFLVWDLVEGKLKFRKRLMEGPLTKVVVLPTHKMVAIAGKHERNYKISCWKLRE